MIQNLISKLQLKGILILFLGLSLMNCQAEDSADSNLITGLLVGQSQGRTEALSFVTDYNGNWNIGFTYDANGVLSGTPTGRWFKATNPDGSGSIISGYNTNANYFSGGDTTYRILSFNAVNRQVFYQNTPGNNNFSNSTFGRIDFTPVLTTGCELGATKCFYFCERVSGQATLASVISSTLTSNSTTPTSANSCGNFRFSRALFRSDNSTWASVQ